MILKSVFTSFIILTFSKILSFYLSISFFKSSFLQNFTFLNISSFTASSCLFLRHVFLKLTFRYFYLDHDFTFNFIITIYHILFIYHYLPNTIYQFLFTIYYFLFIFTLYQSLAHEIPPTMTMVATLSMRIIMMYIINLFNNA